MAQPSETDKILSVSPQRIEDLYRKGYITAQTRNNAMRKRADAELTKTVAEKGYLGAIYTESIKNLQAGWDNLKESAIREPSGSAKTELYYVGLAMWGQIQMLTSVMNAVGEVTGKVAEQNALRAGASPGLAKTIGFAVDIGTGFVPIGMASRSVAKGVQGIGKRVGKKTAAEGAQAAAGAEDAQKIAQKVIGQGLEADGVKGAEKVIASEVDEGGAKVIREAEERIASSAPPSVADQFAADLKKYQDELGAVTAEQTHEMTAKLASKLNLSLDDVKALVPGQAVDERHMYGYLKALEPRVEEWRTLAQRVMDEGTEAAVNTFAKYTSDLLSYAPKFRGAEVTAGRSVEILKESPPMKKLTDMVAGWDADNMASGNFIGAVTTMAEDVLAMTTEKTKAAQLIVQSNGLWAGMKDKAWPMMREAYMNLLLARPITAVRNFLGNSVAGTSALAERFAGGMFSADRKNGLAATEAFALGKGMMLAIGDGISAWGKAFKGIDASDINKFDFVPGKIPGLLGRVVRAPGDNLRGMDNFFKTIFTRGSYYAQAIREGSQRGLGGDDLAAFVARRVQHPTEAMLKEGQEFATKQTFQNELGTMGKTFQKGLQYGPMALWFPFMKTPINLAKYAWDRTPGLQMLSGQLYRDILAGGVKADMAIGRLTMANMVGFFLTELAKDGIITGSGPVDPALNRVWRATNEPYSIKTKGGSVPISNAEPGSTTVGMVADFVQVLNQLDEPTAGQAAMALGFTLMKDLADKTYFQTVSDLIDLTSGVARGHTPGKTPQQIVAGPLITAATGGPLVAGVARMIDPIKRETQTILDSAIARVPGYSKTLPPDTDVYGDPVLPPQAVGPDWLGLFSPLTIKPLTEDRVKKEGERLQVKIPDHPWQIGGGKARDDFDIRAPFPEDRLPTDLTNEQRYRWTQIEKKLREDKQYGIEAAVLDNEHYKGQPRALQREIFMSGMAQYRAAARDMLMIEDKTLGKKVLENKAAYALPMLKEADRTNAEAQIQEAVALFDSMTDEERWNLLKWGSGTEETEE